MRVAAVSSTRSRRNSGLRFGATEQLEQDHDLDRARLGKHHVAAHLEAVLAGEVNDRQPRHAIEVISELLQFRLEPLSQHGLVRRLGLHARAHRGGQEKQDEREVSVRSSHSLCR